MLNSPWIIDPSLIKCLKNQNLCIILSSMGGNSLGLGVISLDMGGIWLDVGVI